MLIKLRKWLCGVGLHFFYEEVIVEHIGKHKKITLSCSSCGDTCTVVEKEW